MKNREHKISIELKITLLVCASAIVFFTMALRLGYVSMANSLLGTAGAGYVKIADAMAGSIAGIIDREIDALTVITDNSAIMSAIDTNNNRSDNDEKSYQRYLMDMDKKWIESPDDHPAVKEYLENEASGELRKAVLRENWLIDILVTDRSGGLVASSFRPRDFYQAGKEWWQEAFNAGKGKGLVKDIVLNEALKTWTIPFIVPIRNSDRGVVGICRASVDIRVFFGPLQNFTIGKTGTAVLVDDNCYLVFQRETNPFTYKLCESEKMQKVLHDKNRWSVADGIYRYSGKTLLAYSPVSQPIFVENGIKWRVFILQSIREALAPLGTFVIQLLAITIISMICVLIAAKAVFGGLFVRPMKRLREGIERIGRGDLDYRIEIKSSDEIRQLADSFNTMAGSLRKLVSPVAVLDNEMTARKKIETELVKMSGEWQEVFNAFADTVFITDANFNILKVNAAFLKEVKLLRAEDVVGKKCFELFHGADKPFSKCPINHDTLKGKASHVEEVYDPKTDRSFLFTVMPVLNEYEEIVSIAHIVKDITDIKKARRDIERKDEDIKRLEKLGNDFLSILSRCQSMLSEDKQGFKLALDGASKTMNERQKNVVVGAIGDVAKLTKGVDDLLDVIRVENGEADFKMGPVDLRDLIKKLIFGFEPKIKAKGLELKLAVPVDKVMVHADANRIHQVIVNLLDNAIRFTEKGFIKLAVTELRDNVEFSMVDTGIGISKDDLPKVFEKFQQFSPEAVYTEEIGLGLGLALVKAIIERHKGKAWVESDLGKGSKFTFTLPKVQTSKIA